MRNPLSLILNSKNKNNEANIINAIAQQAQIDPAAVEKVLKVSYQLTEQTNTEIVEKQEDLRNTLIAENEQNQKRMEKLEENINQVNDKQKITNDHLKELQARITAKAKKAANGTNQLDSDDLLFGNLSMDELFRQQEKQALETKNFKKEVAKYKRRIWYLIKLHMNDIYDTSRSKRKEDFQDYMYSEMQDYIKDLGVFKIRQKNNY